MAGLVPAIAFLASVFEDHAESPLLSLLLLKERSAMAGKSLSDYLLAEIRRVAERPTLAELRARIEARPPIEPNELASEIIRAERDSR